MNRVLTYEINQNHSFNTNNELLFANNNDNDNDNNQQWTTTKQQAREGPLDAWLLVQSLTRRCGGEYVV